MEEKDRHLVFVYFLILIDWTPRVLGIDSCPTSLARTYLFSVSWRVDGISCTLRYYGEKGRRPRDIRISVSGVSTPTTVTPSRPTSGSMSVLTNTEDLFEDSTPCLIQFHVLKSRTVISKNQRCLYLHSSFPPSSKYQSYNSVDRISILLRLVEIFLSPESVLTLSGLLESVPFLTHKKDRIRRLHWVKGVDGKRHKGSSFKV